MIRQTLAVVRREWLVQRRYPLSMFASVVLAPVYQLALPTLLLGSAFVVAGESFGLASSAGTSDLPGWMVTGLFLASITVGAVTSVYQTLEADRTTGVIEHSWSTPAPRRTYVVGAVMTGTLFGGCASLLIALMAMLLGARFDLVGVALSVPVMALGVLGNIGFGYLVAAALLLLRQAEVLVEVVAMLAVAFSGATFPLTLLPEVARWPTYVLPGTWALDLSRVATLGTPPLVSLEIAVPALVLTSASWAFLGSRVFAAADRALARSGALSQY